MTKNSCGGMSADGVAEVPGFSGSRLLPDDFNRQAAVASRSVIESAAQRKAWRVGMVLKSSCSEAMTASTPGCCDMADHVTLGKHVAHDNVVHPLCDIHYTRSAHRQVCNPHSYAQL